LCALYDSAQNNTVCTKHSSRFTSGLISSLAGVAFAAAFPAPLFFPLPFGGIEVNDLALSSHELKSGHVRSSWKNLKLRFFQIYAQHSKRCEDKTNRSTAQRKTTYKTTRENADL